MKQVAVIGLGNFGYYLATELFQKGHEVIAIDIDKSKIQRVKDLVTQAILADATDKETLESIGLAQVDCCVVCIGTPMEASILVTLHLKEMKIANLRAKATTAEHGKILSKIGADEVFFPEKDMAINMANRIHNPNMIDYLPFIEGYSLAEVAPPKSFIGKTLKEIDLINRYNTQVVAIKQIIPDELVMIPTANFTIKDSDLLIVLGPEEALEKLRKE